MRTGTVHSGDQGQFSILRHRPGEDSTCVQYPYGGTGTCMLGTDETQCVPVRTVPGTFVHTSVPRRYAPVFAVLLTYLVVRTCTFE